MTNAEKSGKKKKSVQEWDFPLFELQWFTAVEDIVIRGMNSSSKKCL